MADRQQTRDAIDRRPEVVAVTFVGAARVQRHAHAQSLNRREIFARQARAGRRAPQRLHRAALQRPRRTRPRWF